MAKQNKILEVNTVGDLILDSSQRDLRQNYFEEANGIRNVGGSFILQRDFGSKAIIYAPPIRPNAHIPITGASNASPIVISTANTDGLQAGDTVFVDGIAGNTAANGVWTVGTVVANTSFGLVGSTGNGTYTAGSGIWCSNDTDTPRPPITIHRAFIFYDKTTNAEYPVIVGVDASSNTRIYYYDSANAVEKNNYSYWLELTRFFTCAIADASIGATDVTFSIGTIAENGVTAVLAADQVQYWIAVNTTQSNETVFITTSAATSLTVDTVIGSSGLNWATTDVLHLYRFPCFKFNWTAGLGATPHIDFHFIEDRRKLNILVGDSSTPTTSYQSIQVMKKDARNYLPAPGTGAVAQIIYGTPLAGYGMRVTTTSSNIFYTYNVVVTGYNFDSIATLASIINTNQPEVVAVVGGSTITITARVGTDGNNFYLTAGGAELQVSNVSQGAVSSGTRYFEGGAVGGSYLRTLPAGWYCESEFGTLNPYFLARGSTVSPYTANSAENIYDKTSGRPWLVTNSGSYTDVSIVDSMMQQRVYLAAEYGGYQKSDPIMQLFIQATNTTTGSPVSSHYFGINFALMNKELTALTLYACQHNSTDITNWVDTSDEYFLCHTVNIQSTNVNGGFITFPTPYTTNGLTGTQIYTFVTSIIGNYLTITPPKITAAQNSGTATIYDTLNHEVDKNRSYPTPRFAAITASGDGIVIVMDGGDNAFFIANHNGSGALEDDNFPDVRTNNSGSRLKVDTQGNGAVLGIEILSGIIHIIRAHVAELYDLQGTFIELLKIDCVSKDSIHVTPYGIAYAGKAGIDMIPLGGGKIVTLNPTWDDFYNGSEYVTGVTPYINDTYRSQIVGGYDETYQESWFRIQVATATSSEIIMYRYSYKTETWRERSLNSSDTIKHFANSRIDKTFYIVTNRSMLEYPNRDGSYVYEDDVRINGAATEYSQSNSVPLDVTINIAEFDDEVVQKILDEFRLNFEGESTDGAGRVTIEFYANEEEVAFDTHTVRVDEIMEWRGVERRGELKRLRIRMYLADDVNLKQLDVKKILLGFLD